MKGNSSGVPHLVDKLIDLPSNVAEIIEASLKFSIAASGFLGENEARFLGTLAAATPAKGIIVDAGINFEVTLEVPTATKFSTARKTFRTISCADTEGTSFGPDCAAN